MYLLSRLSLPPGMFAIRECLQRFFNIPGTPKVNPPSPKQGRNSNQNSRVIWVTSHLCLLVFLGSRNQAFGCWERGQESYYPSLSSSSSSGDTPWDLHSFDPACPVPHGVKLATVSQDKGNKKPKTWFFNLSPQKLRSFLFGGDLSGGYQQKSSSINFCLNNFPPKNLWFAPNKS